MRKTLLITDDFPPHYGGVAAYYSALCRRLPPGRLGVVTVPATDSLAFDRSQTYPVYRLPLLSTNPFLWPKWVTGWRAIGRLYRQQRYGMLLVGQILPYGTIAWLLHLRYRTPYVVIAHGMDIAVPRGRKRILCGKILRRAVRVIANSHATADLLRPYGVAQDKITVITPGVEARPGVSATRLQELQAKYHLTGKQVVLSVGRLVSRKGVREVLTALIKVRTAVPNAVYVIAGDGPERENLHRHARAIGIAPQVIFAGAIPHDELATWYERCDLLVAAPQPDTSGDIEGFGMVYLEAAIHGKPSIATDLPGIREAVLDGVSGLLVPVHDAPALASALIRLLKNPAERHRLGIQGQDRAVREFAWDTRARQLELILR
ncbi:MAG: glycosyltransferase family 4 protein [Patescibacteria group bacterium]|nr:glycosyltransferase family 4 protein [Patescibacteria group bacterium]